MPDPADLSLLAIVVGNASTRFGVFHGREMQFSIRRLNADMPALVGAIAEAESRMPGADRSAVVLATDNPPVSSRLLEELTPVLNHELYRMGEDMIIPIERALDPDARPGQDRLLNALGAFDGLKQACVIIDAGTAVTVDFVDGAGVFQGGAILPGAMMMLRALHGGTAALPEIALARPHEGFIGKNTRDAMLHGVVFGLRGAVRHLAERYAEAYEAYAPVIATGADSPLLFEGDEFVEQFVPDLTLRGIEVACRRTLLADDGEPDDE